MSPTKTGREWPRWECGRASSKIPQISGVTFGKGHPVRNQNAKPVCVRMMSFARVADVPDAVPIRVPAEQSPSAPGTNHDRFL
jgi:hypothetical protein